MIDLVRWSEIDTQNLYDELEKEPELWQFVGVVPQETTFNRLSQTMQILCLSPNAWVRAVYMDGLFSGMVAVAPIDYNKGHGMPHIVLFPRGRTHAKEIAAIAEDELKGMGITHLATPARDSVHARWLRTMGYAPPERAIYTKELK